MFDLDATAARITASILAAQEEYLREAKDMAEQGYRMPTCFHGTSQWVDYDVMCPGCEDGWVDEYSTEEEVRQQARDLAESERLNLIHRRERDHAHALFVHEYVVAGKITPQQAGVL